MSQISENRFLDLTRHMARQISRERKADAMSSALLDRIPSTRDEMETDWRNAAAQIVFDILSGTPRLSDLAPECFNHLENIWLDELKEYLAFVNWTGIREQVYWSPEEARKRHYHDGCEKLRDLLADRHMKDRVNNFAPIKEYIASKYLDEYKHFDAESAKPLIDRKAARLSVRMRRNSGGDIYALEYCQKFYDNIIMAVEESDKDACLAVLQALQHSGTFPGGPGIATGFEVAVAVAFLDATEIQTLWKTGQNVSRDTTF